jgi:hypothetical protein
MADDTPATAVPLQFIESEADGYCDPVNGVCAWPGAATAAPASEDRSSHESRSASTDA